MPNEPPPPHQRDTDRQYYPPRPRRPIWQPRPVLPEPRTQIRWDRIVLMMIVLSLALASLLIWTSFDTEISEVASNIKKIGDGTAEERTLGLICLGFLCVLTAGIVRIVVSAFSACPRCSSRNLDSREFRVVHLPVRKNRERRESGEG